MLHNYHCSLLLWHIFPRYDLVCCLVASHGALEMIGNLWVLRANLARMFERSGVHNSERVSATILESHSKTTSLIRTSHAKDTPISMAFALTSNGPKDWWSFLLKLSWLCPMITDYHTNSQLPRLSKSCHIHIHLVAWDPR